MSEAALAMPVQMDQIATALAQCQAELTNPPKTKTANAGKYTYRYADLAEIIDHVRPVITKYGLAIVQMVAVIEERNFLTSRLLHTSGQYLESVYPLPRQAGSQEMGSAITYARRYSLCALLGIAAEEDEDGQKAGNIPSPDAADRDELIERMGAASVGNKYVMDYARKIEIHKGDDNTVEALTIEAVRALLRDWDTSVEEMKPKPQKPSGKPKKEPETEPEPESGGADLADIDARLREKMTKDGITAEQLKSYYVAAGHQTADVEPQDLPARYISALLGNWDKAATKMKEQR